MPLNAIVATPRTARPPNPFRISARQVLAEAGYASIADAGTLLMDSVVPACCSDGCQVEPDGECAHGCPAVTHALGLV